MLPPDEELGGQKMNESAPIQAPRGVRKFDRPTLVRRSEAVRFLWGDEESHFVSDLIYGRGDRIAGLIYRLGPGELFRTSKTWRPYFDQDRFYFVIQGELTIQDPETGDVATASAGEAVYWRGARYHYGYNFGSEETLVVDWYAPQERAAHVPEIEVSVKKRDPKSYCPGRFDLLGRWPAALTDDTHQRLVEGRVVALRRSTSLQWIHGDASPILMNIYVSSEALTGGTFEVRPSVMGEAETHPGDEVLFALEGELHVYLPETFEWFDLKPLDCLYIPEGTPHRYSNTGSGIAKAAFCVAPGYR
jgi:mannose-6-phosphate isomerase-like protein (cupin superfamily)